MEGSIVLDVDDPVLTANAGRWRLTVDGGAATVERTGGVPDLRVPIAQLGSIYLGGFTFSQWSNAQQVVELTEGAAAHADLMFHSTTTPWCPEIF
jgi:predicted acetyltransferase